MNVILAEDTGTMEIASWTKRQADHQIGGQRHYSNKYTPPRHERDQRLTNREVEQNIIVIKTPHTLKCRASGRKLRISSIGWDDIQHSTKDLLHDKESHIKSKMENLVITSLTEPSSKIGQHGLPPIRWSQGRFAAGTEGKDKVTLAPRSTQPNIGTRKQCPGKATGVI